ncbi:hypothetical protein DFH06DRAFT_617410 [Mycena polygramma]|nr:hypothetical protein DFH06DRAFT_617410 [Mycena polygramma]
MSSTVITLKRPRCQGMAALAIRICVLELGHNHRHSLTVDWQTSVAVCLPTTADAYRDVYHAHRTPRRPPPGYFCVRRPRLVPLALKVGLPGRLARSRCTIAAADAEVYHAPHTRPGCQIIDALFASSGRASPLHSILICERAVIALLPPPQLPKGAVFTLLVVRTARRQDITALVCVVFYRRPSK